MWKITIKDELQELIHEDSGYRSLSKDLQELEVVERGALDRNKTKSHHDSLTGKKRSPSETRRGGVTDSENKRQMGRENHRQEAITRGIVAVG